MRVRLVALVDSTIQLLVCPVEFPGDYFLELDSNVETLNWRDRSPRLVSPSIRCLTRLEPLTSTKIHLTSTQRYDQPNSTIKTVSW
jgi:hypothetical protein